MNLPLFRALIKRYWKLLLSMVLVAALGCATMTALYSTYISLDASMNGYAADYGIPDAVLTTEITDREHLDALLRVEGVQEGYARLTGNTVMRSPAGRTLCIRVMFYGPEDFQRFYYWEQDPDAPAQAVLLEYSFARDNGFALGLEISVKIGDEYRTYPVGGIVSGPETLGIEAIEGVRSRNADFGYVYAPITLLEQEADSQFDQAREEWQEHQDELTQAQEEAQSQYQDAQTQLEEAAKELAQSQTDFAQAKADLADQLAQLTRTQEELTQKVQQLSSLEGTLTAKEQELTAARAEAVNGLAQARQAQEELTAQLAQLQETRQTLLAKEQELTASRAQLVAAREQAVQRLEQLETARALLGQIDQMLADAQMADAAREQLLKNLTDLEERLDDADRLAEGLQTVWNLFQEVDSALSQAAQYSLERAALLLQRESVKNRLAAFGVSEEDLSAALDRAARQANDLRERRQALMNQLEESLSPEQLLANAQALQEQLSQITQRLELGDSPSDAVLLSAMEQAQAGIAQIDDGLSQIDQGLEQIRQGLPAVEEGIPQVEDGLRQAEEAQGQLAEALTAIDQGFEEIRRNRGELDQGKEQIAEALPQVQDGVEQIRNAVQEGERQLSDGEQTLDQRRQEAESSWTDALAEFANWRQELADALSRLEEWQGYQSLCNQFLLRFAPGADPQATLDAAKAALGEVEVRSARLYEDSAAKAIIDGNLIPMDAMSSFVPALFFGVALVVVFLFLSLMVRQSRREIGILRAMGFSRRRIRGLFAALAGLAALLASGLGGVLGWRIGVFMQGYFAKTLVLPVLQLHFDWPVYLLSAGLTFAVCQAAALLSTGLVGRIQPTEAMSRPAPQTARDSFFVRRVLKKASPFVKFSVASTLRNRLRFAFSVVCLSASVMLIYAAFTFISSKNQVVEDQSVNRIHYDCQIFFSQVQNDDQLAALSAVEGVTAVERLDYYVTDVSFGDRTVRATLNALPEHTEMVGIRAKDGRELSVPEEGLLLEAHLAQELGAGVGDKVTVNGVELPIVELSWQANYRFQYLSLTTAKALGAPTMGTVLCRLDGDREEALTDYLVTQDDYVYSVFTRVFLEGMNSLYSTYDTFAWIIVAFAVAIGMVIVVNTSQTNLLEQQRELCTLRVLGFRHGAVSRYWFSQSVLYFLCACVLGFPGGQVVARITLDRMSDPTREFPYPNAPGDFLITAGLLLAFLVLSHFISMAMMHRWDLVEQIKEKE